MGEIDIITQYLLAIVPAVSAIAAMITTVGVAIGKIKKANASTVEAVESNNQALRKANVELKDSLTRVEAENVELKKSQQKLMDHLNHVSFVEE